MASPSKVVNAETMQNLPISTVRGFDFVRLDSLFIPPIRLTVRNENYFTLIHQLISNFLPVHYRTIVGIIGPWDMVFVTDFIDDLIFIKLNAETWTFRKRDVTVYDLERFL